MAFVRRNLAAHVRELEEHGIRFAFRELGVDRFHEVGFYSPDGHLVRMMEARTFSGVPRENPPDSIIGQIAEISLRTRQFEAAIGFWAKRGFIVDADDEAYDIPGHVSLIAPGIIIGLRDKLRWTEPVLRFLPANLPSVTDLLEEKGISAQATDEGIMVMAPEGTRLILAENAGR
jgi:hypothetical protein